MAKKVPQPHNSKAKAPAVDVQDVNELEVLNPDFTIEIGGQNITVREYGHVEWFRLLYRVEPLVALIAERLSSQKNVPVEEVFLIFSEHMDAMLPCILQAADMTFEVFNTLKTEEIELLVIAWWRVNHHFFINRALSRSLIQYSESKGAQQALGKSTQP